MHGHVVSPGVDTKIKDKQLGVINTSFGPVCQLQWFKTFFSTFQYFNDFSQFLLMSKVRKEETKTSETLWKLEAQKIAEEAMKLSTQHSHQATHYLKHTQTINWKLAQNTEQGRWFECKTFSSALYGLCPLYFHSPAPIISLLSSSELQCCQMPLFCMAVLFTRM